MENLRAMMASTLGRSLGALMGKERLSLAWVVACGRVLAERGEVTGYDDGVVEVAVNDRAWLQQFRTMSADLERELERIAGVPVTGIHFYEKRTSTGE